MCYIVTFFLWSHILCHVYYRNYNHYDRHLQLETEDCPGGMTGSIGQLTVCTQEADIQRAGVVET